MTINLHTPAQQVRGERSIESMLRDEISRNGSITFHSFMSTALYAPEWGYYIRHGPGRDYRTAPQTSPAFGHLLARSFERMRETVGPTQTFDIAEYGAGTGELANTILDYMAPRMPEQMATTRYRAVDHRPRSISANPAMSWLPPTSSGESHRSIDRLAGVIFSNELFDAFPVHRIVGTDGSPGEIWVEVVDDRFTATLGPISDFRALEILMESDVHLEVGQVVDVATEAPEFYRQMCRSLSAGIVLTIDYGGEAADIYSPRRRGGTLISAHRHTAENRPLDRPGDQDLTAHVDFTSLRRVGQEEGLDTVLECDQRMLLMSMGLREWVNGFDGSILSAADLFNARAGASELVRLDGMGRFRVLIQSRGVEISEVRSAFGLPTT